MEKGRYKVDHARSLDVDAGRWYLVQTNYEDRFGGDMPYDTRRKPAENKLDQIGRQYMDYETLMANILEEYPTWRGDKNSTIHATVMGAGEGYIHTKLYDHKKYRLGDAFSREDTSGQKRDL